MQRLSVLLCLVLLSSAILGSLAGVVHAESMDFTHFTTNTSGTTHPTPMVEHSALTTHTTKSGDLMVKKRQFLDTWKAKMNARKERFADFIKKLQSREDKLVAEGKDVTELKAQIAKLQQWYDNSSAQLAKIMDTLDKMDLSGTTNVNTQAISQQLKAADDLFKPLLEGAQDSVHILQKIYETQRGKVRMPVHPTVTQTVHTDMSAQ